MTDMKLARSTPADRVGDLKRIQGAMGRGVWEALRRHKQAGNPVAIWREGGVEWVAPEQIPVEDEELTAAT